MKTEREIKAIRNKTEEVFDESLTADEYLYGFLSALEWVLDELHEEDKKHWAETILKYHGHSG